MSDNDRVKFKHLKVAMNTSKQYYDEKMDLVYSDLSSKDNKLSSQIKDKANQVDLEIERKRINLLTKIESGQTEGNTELLDIRAGANGEEYDTAGEAVRDIARGKGIVNKVLTVEKTDFANRINLLNSDEVKVGYGLKTSSDNDIEGSIIANDSNVLFYKINVKPGTTYKFYTDFNIDFAQYNKTQLSIVEFDDDGMGIKYSTVSGGNYSPEITTTSDTKYINLSVNNINTNLNYYKRLMMCESNFIPKRFYYYSEININEWEERIKEIEESNDKFNKYCNNGCKLIENEGFKIDFSNATNVSNCTIEDDKTVRFSDTSKRVTATNDGDCWFNIPYTIGNWESITIAFYQPYTTYDTSSDTGGYFYLYLNDMTSTNKRVYFNGKSKWGWNIVKISKNMFNAPPDIITNLYFNFIPRNNVPTGGDFGTIIFDSIIFNQRIKPVFMLNFDQWWEESLSNGAYQYCFDNNIPVTLMTKNYDALDEKWISLAKKAESQYGWENGYYACYGNYNSKFTNLSDFSTGKEYVEEMKKDFANKFLHDFKSYGCTQMTLTPLAETVLLDSGISIIRGLASTPTGYFDINTKWLPSNYGIDYADESDIDNIKGYIDDLITYGSAGVFFTHGVCNDENTTVDSTSNAMRLTMFKDMINYLVSLRQQGEIEIMTMKQFYEKCIN